MLKTKQHSFSFDGKVVLVTGGATGIGRATALAFGQAGATVVIADTFIDGGHMTAAMLVEQGGKALFVKTDVGRAADVQALFDKIGTNYGRLDVAFNNAGIEEEHLPLTEGDEAMFDRIMNVNVKGVWLCMKQEIAMMARQGGGAIVNTASVAGLVGAPSQSIYAASKHAVVGMSKTAAAEYARAKVRINTICPGVINTPMLTRALERHPERDKLLSKLQKAHPAGRFGEAAEVANAVLWLCSDESPFVTGHQLAIDGGLSAI